MTQTITLTINGQPVTVPAGTTVLEAARKLGIDIPTLCHHPELVPGGACRLCVVEVEKFRNLPASCALPATEGMVVQTHSLRVEKARRLILELLVANHPLDCFSCEKNGDCRLQDYSYAYRVTGPRRPGARREDRADDTNPFFSRDFEKCILCGRCVGVCHDVQQIGAIDFTKRGFDTKVTSAYDAPLTEAGCVFCGMCVDACPVGALTPKLAVGAGRAWEKRKVRTTCTYCGVGCAINLLVKDGRVVGAEGALGSPANEGHTCVKGKFGWDFIHRDDRLTTPLIRRGGKDGQLEPASWDEALDLVARRFSELKEKHGPDALGGLSSAKCTNEENYLLQKLVRTAFGTNNVDHCARLCHASTVAGLALAFGSGAMTNSIGELSGADVIFVIGSNTTEAHPVIGLEIKKAVARRAKLIVADPRRIPLAEKADLFLQLAPGTNIALVNGLAHVIVKSGWVDARFVTGRTEGYEAWAKAIEKYTPEYVAKLTGIPAELIVEAARAYATADTASIVYSMGVTQHATGTDGVLAIANLAMVAGQIGRPHTGVNPLRGQNNVQGACDVGALPDVFPGYQKVVNNELRAKFEKSWGRPLSGKAGLTVTEMIPAAAEGTLKGLYIMGENPMLSDPDVGHVEEGLRNLEFLVVQDIFLTETARLADVVLPGVSFAEKDGTFTNTERRVQLVQQAVAPVGEARPDWQILIDLAERFGLHWSTRTPAAVMEEIASLTPIYGGILHRRLGHKGLQWPCPNADHPGTPYLHKEKFSRGKGLFHPVEYQRPHELPDDEYPFILSTGRLLYHYHTGTLTRRSVGLAAHRPQERSEINPADAGRLGIGEGDVVRITSRRGSVLTRACLTERVPAGVVFMTFHFAESAANILTAAALDPVAKIAEFKVSAVRVEKAAPATTAGAPAGAEETGPALPEEYARVLAK